MEKGETGDLSPREGQCEMFGGKEGTSQGDSEKEQTLSRREK